MKTIIDYLKEHGEYEHDVMGRDFKIELIGNDIVLSRNDKTWKMGINQLPWVVEVAIQDILDQEKIAIRFCEECGKPFDAGFIAGDGDWYCCEDCFDDAMDNTYGKGKWRPTEYEGENGGYYESLDGDEWVDTSIYYTEWY